MKFTVSYEVLKEVLRQVIKNVPKKSTMIILLCGLFELKDNDRYGRTTNAEAGSKMNAEVVGEKEGDTDQKVVLLDKDGAENPDYFYVEQRNETR